MSNVDKSVLALVAFCAIAIVAFYYNGLILEQLRAITAALSLKP